MSIIFIIAACIVLGSTARSSTVAAAAVAKAEECGENIHV